MRRIALASLVLLAVGLAGCNSDSTTKRTVTVVNTVTSAPATDTKPSSVVVVAPTTTAGSTPKPTPRTTPTPARTTTSSSAAPIVKIDPLKADCTTTLDAADIKKAIGASIGATTNRIRLGATGKGSTGAIRCLYGSRDAGKSAPVRVRLTQYTTAAAAKKQVDVDVQAAQDAGAKVTRTTVTGYPASLQLKAGGVLEMQYGTWTLSVAVSDKQASDAALTKGLPVLAGQALVRIIKNA